MLPGSMSGMGVLLCPPCTESPFATNRCYLLAGSIYYYLCWHYPTIIAHTGSCARPRSSPALCQWLVSGVFAGCCESLLENGPSRRYLCESFPGCLDPYPGGFLRCTYPFLPIGTSAFPPLGQGRLPTISRTTTSVRGSNFGAAVIPLCSGLRVCLPPRSFLPLWLYVHRAAVTFTSEQHMVCYLSMRRIY